MTNQKVYNINAMRPAIVKMREKGNRGVITAKLCSELGISETYYTWYKKSIEGLFQAVCQYCRLKNSPKADSQALAEALEAIYPLWKDLLSTAERDKMQRELRVTKHDISNLVSFCQIFVDDANDISRGQDDTFVAHKVWAVQNLRRFQQRVETDLGIRIAQVEVLSDTQRDYLRNERRILSKWRKAERRIQDLAAQKESLLAVKAKAKGSEVKALMDEQIAGLDEQIEAIQQKIQGLKADYATLQQQNQEAENSPTPEEPQQTA